MFGMKFVQTAEFDWLPRQNKEYFEFLLIRIVLIVMYVLCLCLYRCI